MSKKIGISVPDKKYVLWKSFADKKGMSLGDFIRRIVDGYIVALLNKEKKS